MSLKRLMVQLIIALPKVRVESEWCNSRITVESRGNAECKMDSEEEAQRGKEKYWSWVEGEKHFS
jgi:hypothetical protein